MVITHKIRKVDKVKFLGVFIDDQLSWDYQIENIENKLLSTIVGEVLTNLNCKESLTYKSVV